MYTVSTEHRMTHNPTSIERVKTLKNVTFSLGVRVGRILLPESAISYWVAPPWPLILDFLPLYTIISIVDVHSQHRAAHDT